MQHLYQFFTSVDWWRFQPAPDMLLAQPIQSGMRAPAVAARTETGDMAVIYVPDDSALILDTRSLAANLMMEWVNVRTGDRTIGFTAIQRIVNLNIVAPSAGDWLVWFRQSHELNTTRNQA